MLASITPLGERSRGNRHAITITAFVAGTTLGGALLGSILGQIGALVSVDARLALEFTAAVCVLGLLTDLPHSRFRLPSTRRQVDASWLDTYRGTVYGFGFGAQLGLAVVTVVSSALTYVWMTASLLTGSLLSGLAIGATFGAVRGLTALPSTRVTNAERFRGQIASLERWEPRVRRASLGVEAAVPLALAITVLT